MKIYKHRKLHGLKRDAITWAALPDDVPLSVILNTNMFCSAPADVIHFVGSDDRMTREWMAEPNDKGWKFANSFVFKNRVATYERRLSTGVVGVDIRLINHRNGWLPGCDDYMTALHAWRALESEWLSTGLPLLSTPRATGIALLWENLPRGVEFPALPDDLARLIRANSPQHRIQAMRRYAVDMDAEPFPSPADCVQYDGRWMYASLCGLDRLPIGEPRRAEGFTPYVPGIYDVTIRIPETWSHIGLIPMLEDTGVGFARAWKYPSEPGRIFRTWAFEPELTLALKKVKDFGLPAWEIVDFHDGYKFEKGRPLMTWAHKLIEMRERLQAIEANCLATAVDVDAHMLSEAGHFKRFDFAAAAIRQILNHSIGALHKNEYQRETFVSEGNYRKWRRENPHLAGGDDVLKVEGGYMVPAFVADTSPLSIFMPHWSSTLYSLARARVAEWALLCEPETLVKIHGDALYSTVAQPKLDKLDDSETLGRPRRK